MLSSFLCFPGLGVTKSDLLENMDELLAMLLVSKYLEVLTLGALRFLMEKQILWNISWGSVILEIQRFLLTFISLK